MATDAPQILGDPPGDYAGDVGPREAWRQLQHDPSAQLVDVRSAAEWTFVGVPDLAALNKTVVAVEWQIFPGMHRNEDFADQMKAQLAQADDAGTARLYFLCRSGGRSLAAARLAAQHGMTRAYNIAGGFEGDKDSDGHRGRINGWKADGLAWVQG